MSKKTAKSALIIPERVLQAQTRASDPERSVWLAANAGSGKTHVLTTRVIRLLLGGVNPARIVCLTYTNAAAAVMQTRIFDRLSQWTSMDDANLAAELARLEQGRGDAGNKEASHCDAAKLVSARRLFARALETPGGLKIQTVHAFCEAILHQFPVEANIAGHFELMDDLATRHLLDEARRHCLERVWSGDEQKLRDALHLILEKVGAFGLDELFKEAMNKREALKLSLARFERQGCLLFYSFLNLKEGETQEEIAQQLKQAALFSEEEMAQLSQYGGKKSKEFVEKLFILQREPDWQQFFRLTLAAYYDSKGEEPLKNSTILIKDVQKNMPDMPARFAAKKERVIELVEKARAFELIRLNEAAYHLITNLIEYFERLKQSRGLLDFDDLIYRTLGLLRRKGVGQWVQYKLDHGIEHILVDEAQDTAPVQWQIIRLLSDEFFTGVEAQTLFARTIFAVGDEKQSIYSFQGALPEAFAENGLRLRKKSRDALKLFDMLRLDFSFRSTADVLDAVDAVFGLEDNYQGLSAENIPTVHQAIRKDAPGEVMVWQALESQGGGEPEDWSQTVEHQDSPPLVLARQIAETIDNWLKRGEVLVGQKRLLRPGDIMVLVRARDSFVHALGRELKNRSIAVAGSDRLRLNEHIAIRDLMALARFVLQPVDDLSLACVLKSPLFGFDEEALYTLAAQREKCESFYQALERKQGENPQYAASFISLQHYRALVDMVPVYEFYSRILNEDGGRRKILARLGSQAGDVLDAFMDYTLAVQQNGLPGLQAFVETLSQASPEIKREMDQAHDEVRIMTVHAAKGLEAAVVFLVDGGKQIWSTNQAARLLTLSKEGTSPVMVWNPAKFYQTHSINAVLAQAKTRQEEEYRRLLYVGMTRAEDRLIVCGYKAAKTPKNSWLTLVHHALADKLEPLVVPPAEGVKAWRYQTTKNQLALYEPQVPIIAPPIPPPLPAFLREKMAQEPALPRPLNPSKGVDFIDDEIQEFPKEILTSPVLEKNEAAPNIAVARGVLIHRILQYLPYVAAPYRFDRLRSFLARQTQDWPDAARLKVERQLHNLFEDKRLARLFAPHARAEVSLMGKVVIGGVERVVCGQIDRLTVGDDEVLFADFKTGRVPRREAEIPQGYLVQMALYQQLLKPLYPDRPITALLIYTQGAPDIFQLDNTELDRIFDKT